MGLRRLLSIGLIGCLGIPFAGAYLWMVAQVYIQKSTIQEKIRSESKFDNNVLLSFSKKDAETKLEWEHSREFKYRGEMYDVIRSETIGDSIKYLCYHDKKETQLKKCMNEILVLFSGSNSSNQGRSQVLVQFFHSLFPPDNNYNRLPVIAYPNHKPAISQDEILLQGYRYPPFHPPELS